jgi:hypothetical protein
MSKTESSVRCFFTISAYLWKANEYFHIFFVETDFLWGVV